MILKLTQIQAKMYHNKEDQYFTQKNTFNSNVFRLHYKATLVVFVLASLLVTSRQYIGDPIDCIVDGVPGGIMDTYCWIHSTYSIPTRWTGKEGHVVPHPGNSHFYG